MTGKSMALFGTLVFKTTTDMQYRSRTLTYIHNSLLYGRSLSYQSLTTVTKNSILDVCKGPRSVSGIHDILLSYILISYLIYLEKSKTMFPFTHSFQYTITIKIKNITRRIPVNVSSPEENVTSQGFHIFRQVCIPSFDSWIA